MKKALLLFCIFFSANQFCFSQAWAPVGATWYYHETYFSSPAVGFMKIESIAVALINGKLCSQLQKNSWVCDTRSSTEYMYEDSGRVFFYDADRNSFQMLFNINAAPGNSWVIYPSSSATDSITITVDSVSTVIINSVSLKVIYVSYSNFGFTWLPYNNACTFIERIGNTTYMFPWELGVCDVSWAMPIRCYSDTVLGFVDFDSTNACDYSTVGIPELNSEKLFSLSPNPAHDFLNIKNKQQKNLSITIFSSIGEAVTKTIVMKDVTTSINLSALPAGIYLVTAQSDKNFASRKIVKQ